MPLPRLAFFNHWCPQCKRELTTPSGSQDLQAGGKGTPALLVLMCFRMPGGGYIIWRRGGHMRVTYELLADSSRVRAFLAAVFQT